MENLKGKLEQHYLWVKSGGKEGNKIDLSGANLRNFNLTRTNLVKANLSSANLSEADLDSADLTGANLVKADLSGANLTNASLAGADLSKVNLTNASLAGADLSGANLTNANLVDMNLANVNLSLANLTGVKGIATKEEEMKAAQKVLSMISQPGNKLDMSCWHTCETSHCIAGWLCPENEYPAKEAARKVPTLVKYFFADNDEAYNALQRVASGEESIYNSLS